jgi:hypothetical protein
MRVTIAQQRHLLMQVRVAGEDTGTAVRGNGDPGAAHQNIEFSGEFARGWGWHGTSSCGADYAPIVSASQTPIVLRNKIIGASTAPRLDLGHLRLADQRNCAVPAAAMIIGSRWPKVIPPKYNL